MKRLNLVIFFSICVTKCLAMSRSELEDFSNFLEMTSQLDFNVKSKGPDDEYDEDELVSDNAWEESGKFEGDLILNERQRRLLVADIAEGLSRNGLQDSTKRWPNNEVIYYIQKEHFSSGQVQAIQDGIDDLAQASCVKFTPYKKGDRDAVVIQGSRRGCFSQVGYQGGYQVLNLSGRHPVGRGCFRHGTVVHELLHSLGFYHMQSSPDRDDYIDVLWQNIVQPARHNFRKYNSFAVSDFGVGYDYESVLHYSRKAFSSNGQDTLVPKQRGAEIGQRVGLSQKDIQKLNRMYCDADSNDAINSDDVSRPKKPVITKKNSKNKPFDGHGIGYHQGKTVVIKLKPTVELYGLATLPKFHMFDSFSKAPQAMSPSLIESGREGKEMIHETSTSSANENLHIPITSKSLLPIKDQDQEKYEGKADIEMVNHRENEKNPLTSGQMNENKEFSEEAYDTQDDFKQRTLNDFLEYTGFNPDYSKYFNPEYKYEKEPEIVKVDKIFRSSKSLTNDAAESDDSDKKPVPVEHQHNAKQYEHNDADHKFISFLPQSHDSQAKDDFEKIYPLRKYYYNPDEVDTPEFQSPLKYFSGQSQNNDTDSDSLISLRSSNPINENWYTDNQYKQNPNRNYDTGSYSYDPLRKENKDTAQSFPLVRHYVISENVHDSEKNNQNPYFLFGAPIPLTHKWYRKDEPEK